MDGSSSRQIVRTMVVIAVVAAVVHSVVSPPTVAARIGSAVVRMADTGKPLTPEERQAYVEQTKKALTAAATKPDGSNASNVNAVVTLVGGCLDRILSHGRSISDAEATCAKLLDDLSRPTGTESYALTPSDLAWVSEQAGSYTSYTDKEAGWADEDVAAMTEVVSACLKSELARTGSRGAALQVCELQARAIATVKAQANAAPIVEEAAAPNVPQAVQPPLVENPNLSSRRNADGSITEWEIGQDGVTRERTRHPDGTITDWHDPYAETSTASSGGNQAEDPDENIQIAEAEEEGGNNEGNSKRRTGSDKGKKDEKNHNSGGGSQHSGGCNCGNK